MVEIPPPALASLGTPPLLASREEHHQSMKVNGVTEDLEYIKVPYLTPRLLQQHSRSI